MNQRVLYYENSVIFNDLLKDIIYIIAKKF